MGDADEPDVPAGAGGADRLVHRLLGSHGFDDAVRPETAGEFLDAGHPGVPTLFDDVGRAEPDGESPSPSACRDIAMMRSAPSC